MRLLIKRSRYSEVVLPLGSVIDLPAARTRLEPLEPALIKAAQTGTKTWFDLMSEHPGIARPLDTTTRANIIQNHAVDDLALSVEEIAGASLITEGRRTLLKYGEILLRFKFVGHGVPRNVNTTIQQKLARQQFDDGILPALGVTEEMADPTILSCGYTLGDKVLGRVEIRRDCKYHPTWSFAIYGDGASIENPVIEGLPLDVKPASITSTKKKDDAQREVG